jgi:hypothetical protein
VISAPGTPTLPLHAAPRPESQTDGGPKEGETDLEKQLRESIALVQLRRTGEGAGTPTPAVATPEALPVHNTVNGSKGSASNGSAGTASLHGSNGVTGGSAPANGASSNQFPWAEFLLAQTRALTDVYAAAIDYAGKQHGNSIKPEDLRALMLSAFINLSQRGGTGVRGVDR